MANFEEAIDFVLKNEGGYANNPLDRGGATNFGLSTQFLNRIALGIPAEQLTRDQAIDIYKKYFWIPYPLGKILDQKVANKIFDCLVNMGEYNAINLVQRTCNKLSAIKVSLNGIFTKETLDEINKLNILSALKEAQANYYKAIVMSHPNQRQFLHSWLTRAARG